MKNSWWGKTARSFIDAIENGYGEEFLVGLAEAYTLVDFLPDLQACVGLDGGIRHAEDVSQHLLDALHFAHLDGGSLSYMLAALFHDIGKPLTYKKDVQGRVTFYKHEIVGAKIAWNLSVDLCKVTGNTSIDPEYISNIVRHHMYNIEDTASDSAIRRWLWDVGVDWKDVISFRSVDRRANSANQGKAVIWTVEMRKLLDRCREVISKSAAIWETDLDLPRGRKTNIGLRADSVCIFKDLIGLVNQDPSRNNEKWLTEYLAKRNI